VNLQRWLPRDVAANYLKNYTAFMQAIEFITDLTSEPVLAIPQEVVAQLPKAGRVRVIVLTDGDSDDAEWRLAAYEQFMRDDSSDDAVYDNY